MRGGRRNLIPVSVVLWLTFPWVTEGHEEDDGGPRTKDEYVDPSRLHSVPDPDEAAYTLKDPVYTRGLTKKNTIVSDYKVCDFHEPYRRIYGSKQRISKEHAIPVSWSDTLGVNTYVFSVAIYDLLSAGYVLEVFVPFIFIAVFVTIALLSIIPMIIFGALLWAILFNTLRFFGHKKIRMIFRSILICWEKYRRWKYQRSFPVQHLRKFRERDRYQMPKVFQNSDYSSDDEPVELTREQIPRKKTTMWTKNEIAMMGFDPDNINLDRVYGDLWGNEKDLDPIVHKYVQELLSHKDRKARRKEAKRKDSAQVFGEFLHEMEERERREREAVEKEKERQKQEAALAKVQRLEEKSGAAGKESGEQKNATDVQSKGAVGSKTNSNPKSGSGLVNKDQSSPNRSKDENPKGDATSTATGGTAGRRNINPRASVSTSRRAGGNQGGLRRTTIVNPTIYNAASSSSKPKDKSPKNSPNNTSSRLSRSQSIATNRSIASVASSRSARRPQTNTRPRP